MRKAFIAAPLIGTLIFLTAIVFTVNINKAETARVQEITADSYHNRIVSLLELYRADLGSLFRESMSRLIENVLLVPRWSLFDVPFSTGGHPELAEPYRTMLNRFESCTQVAAVIDAMVCADTATTSNCPMLTENQCRDATGCSWDPNAGPTGGCQLNVSQGASYGLQEWLMHLNDSGFFEGVKFEPAIGSKFVEFVRPPRIENGVNTGFIDSNQYTKNCHALIPGSLFDCVNFAKNNSAPFRCCAKYRDTSTNVGDIDVTQRDRWPSTSRPEAIKNYECTEVVPGCEDGVFLVQLKVSDERVFPSLPRLEASDGSGNVIRSGAIADNDFRLTINCPVYKYMDASYRLYDRVAYGKVGTVYPAGANQIDWAAGAAGSAPGVAAGYCVGGTDCKYQNPDDWRALFPRLPQRNTLYFDEGVGSAFVIANANEETVLAAGAMPLAGGAGSLLQRGLNQLCTFGSNLKINFTEMGVGAGVADCFCTGVGAGDCSQEGWKLLLNRVSSGLRNTQIICPSTPSGEKRCYYLTDLNLPALIIDETPAYRVSRESPNIYSWTLRLSATGLAPP